MSFSQDLTLDDADLSILSSCQSASSVSQIPETAATITPSSPRSPRIGACPAEQPRPAAGRVYSGSARGWCFTCNLKERPVGFRESVERLHRLSGATYSIAGLELAPTTGRPHVQGYVYKKSKLSAVKLASILRELFDSAPHLERARGTPQENQTYCSKDGDYFEFGQCPSQGSRSDLAALAQAVIAGESLADIATKHPSDYIRYHGGIKAFHLLTHSKPRDMHVASTVHWWFGPTGVGKSRKAFEMFGDSAYVKMNDKWWDGYTGQSQVIFDDYRPSLCPFHELLRILDRYPYRVQPKGGSIELSANVFVVTTCSRPEVLWHNRTEEQLNQLLRRITHIVEFTTSGDEIILKGPETNYSPLTKEELAAMFPPEPQPNLKF